MIRWGRLGLAIADSAAWVITFAAAGVAYEQLPDAEGSWSRLLVHMLLIATVQIPVGYLFRLNLGTFRIGSIDEAISVLQSWFVVATLALALLQWYSPAPLPQAVHALSLPLALCLQIGPRFAWRLLQMRAGRLGAGVGTGKQPVIVFGAGEGGEQITRALLREPSAAYVPVALLDDDPGKARRVVGGVKVAGTRGDMGAVASRTGARTLLVAIPSASSALVEDLKLQARQAQLGLLVLPSTSELLGTLSVRDIRAYSEADMLGRAEVEVDLDGIRTYVACRRVLVTGAGGSIGSELCRQLSKLGCAELHMLDRDESALHALQLSIDDRASMERSDLIVCDIRDAASLDTIFQERGFDIVFHTAALKHVSLLERYPDEAYKSNVIGTHNILMAAQRNGVTDFVNVSTDKAVEPTTALGSSKLIAERLTSCAALASGRRFLSVRFGNVLNSRGSVIPTFRQQIALGTALTVTHPDVTRFFMTIPEAVRLVLQSLLIGRAGEILVLDMGTPVRIADIARRLIEDSGRELEILYTGLRPGEKLHESLVGSDEIAVAGPHRRILHIAGSPELKIELEENTGATEACLAVLAATDRDRDSLLFSAAPSDRLGSG
jgi:FlaA1/EpsC-like NDP-sugar epimerase